MANFSAEPLSIEGALLIRAERFADARGYFMETYSFDAFAALGVDHPFVQDNQSFSARRGTVRGLHFQTEPHAQAKLVRVLAGRIFDVLVDIRPQSAGFGRWCAVELTPGETALFAPRGVAHGFCTIEDATIVAYKVDAPYLPSADRGIAWDDPALAIPWPIARDAAVLSAKDAALPLLADALPPK